MPTQDRQRKAGSPGLSRRELVITIPVSALAPRLAAAAAPEALRSLSPKQMRIVEAMVARLIPSDENGPGAREAGVARYIDRALAEARPTERDDYTASLTALDAYAQANHGAAFADLSPDRQDMVLTALEQNRAPGLKPDSRTFFDMVRNQTLEGMFGDPHYGGNANFIGWDLIGYPGLRPLASGEEQKLRVKVKPARQSAYGGGRGGH